MVTRYFHTPAMQENNGTFCIEITTGPAGGQIGINHLTDYTTRPLNAGFVERTEEMGLTLLERADQAVERGKWFEICLLPYTVRDWRAETNWGSW